MANVEAALPAQEPPPHEHGRLLVFVGLRRGARLGHILVLHAKQHRLQREVQVGKHEHVACRVFAVFVLYKA